MSITSKPFLRPGVEELLLDGNEALLDELLPWLLRAPTITTYRVNLLKTTLDCFKATVENALRKKYNNPPKVFTMSEIPEVLCIGRLPDAAIEQPKSSSSKEIIVDCSCAAALLRGAHIYAPGVLAMETGTQLADEVAVFADLSGQCRKGTSTRYESPLKMFIGIGVARMQRHQLYAPNAVSHGIAIEMKCTISGVPALGDLSGPEALLQNLPSILCVRVLDPKPGECVLDMCAAPGNKTSHIAEMMRDEGIIVALDKTENKIKYVREKIEQNALHCVHAFPFDATLAYDANGFRIGNGVDIRPPFAGECFDRVLLDAPCSALGNRPVLMSLMTPKMLKSFPHVQRKLFTSAVHLLKTSGVLVYSTCTITVDENEGMVAWALNKFPQLKLIEATPKFVGSSKFGFDDEQCRLVQRFGGYDDYNRENVDTVGFFIAKFKKVPL